MKIGRNQQGCLGMLIEYQSWNHTTRVYYGSPLATIRMMEALCRKGLAEKVLDKYYPTTFGKKVYEDNVNKYGKWR